MKYVFDAAAVALAPLAAPASLLVFDFDGTLAPIVWDRAAAALRASTRKRLARLCVAYPCAVVTGREHADVAVRLAGLPLCSVVGNHGAVGAAAATWSAPIVAALRDSLGAIAGVEIEDKHRGVAIHYRKAPHPLAAIDAISRAVAALGAAVRAVHGKMVVDLLPIGAPTKGDAVRDLRQREAAATVLYIGDDATDEDVFALAEPWLIGVRVGLNERSGAGYFVTAQDEIDRLLDCLLALRPGATVGSR